MLQKHRQCRLPAWAVALLLASGAGLAYSLAESPVSAEDRSCAPNCFWATGKEEVWHVHVCGTPLWSIPLVHIPGSAYGCAVAESDSELWIASSSPNVLSRLDMDGTVLDWFSLAAAIGEPTGLALDDTSLWVSTDAGMVYEYSFSGAPVSAFATATSNLPVAIALGDTTVWVLDKSGYLYEFAKDGGGIRQFSVHQYCPYPVGLAFDTAAETFWLLDGDQDVVSLVDLEGQLTHRVTVVGVYWLQGIDLGSGTCYPNGFQDVSAEGNAELMAGLWGLGAMPNPFGLRTAVVFGLNRGDHVTVQVFDVSGRSVRTLANRHFHPGMHRIEWDGRTDAGADVASGTYFARMSSTWSEDVVRLTLIK